VSRRDARVKPVHDSAGPARRSNASCPGNTVTVGNTMTVAYFPLCGHLAAIRLFRSPLQRTRRGTPLFSRRNSRLSRKKFPVLEQKFPVRPIQARRFPDRSDGRRRRSGDVHGSLAPLSGPAGADSLKSAFGGSCRLNRLPLPGVKILGESRPLCYICSPAGERRWDEDIEALEVAKSYPHAPTP
jgi:hypothetical protein